MRIYRVGILGCRGRGTAAALAYHAHPRTTIVGLCDLKPELLGTLGDQLGVQARFTDLDEMISQTGPDIVVIATGTEFHYDLSMRVLEHGVHIDVEKPICVDLIQADAVLAKAREQGVRVAVHHQGRVGAFMQAVARGIAEGSIGEVRYLYGSGKGYYGGYGLMNIGTHMLNNMLRVGGPCRRVQAVVLTDGRPITPEDVITSPSGMGTIAGECITALLHFESGLTAALLQHRMNPVDVAAYMLEIYGTQGRMIWKSSGAWRLPMPHFVPGSGKEGLWEPLAPIYPDPFEPGRSDSADYGFVEEFVQALDEGRDHECSGADARHALEIMMGIFESGAYGRCVDLPQVRRDHPLLRWRSEAGMGPPPPVPRSYPEWLVLEDQRLGRRG